MINKEFSVSGNTNFIKGQLIMIKTNIKEKIDLNTYENANRYNRFINEPSPSVCVSGNFDITNIYKQKLKGHKLNALLCYCVLQAAQNIKEFHYSIKEDGLYYYKNVKTNAVVNGIDGKLYYADYKYYDTFEEFEKEYDKINEYCYSKCTHYQEDTGALIGTSAIVGYPFTSISLDISPKFWDNFILWGKYVKKLFKTTLNISLRFHHATIDGQRAAQFFNELQKQFNTLKTKRKKLIK